jgi:hypothetical protein
VYKAALDEFDDEVDMTIEEALRGYKLRFPLVRLGDGYYVFGLKTIFLKILMGKLVVKLGSGILPFDEFMNIYYE